MNQMQNFKKTLKLQLFRNKSCHFHSFLENYICKQNEFVTQLDP